MPSIAARVDKLEAALGGRHGEQLCLCLLVDGATDDEVLTYAQQLGYDPANGGHRLILRIVVDPPGTTPTRDGPKVRVLH